MRIDLAPELERLVEEKVRSGAYASPTEVVADALRLLDELDRPQPDDLEDFRAKIEEGLAQLDAGLGIPGEVVRRRSYERLKKLAARR